MANMQNPESGRVVDMNTLKAKALAAKKGEIPSLVKCMEFDLRERGCTRVIMTLGRSGQWEKAIEFYEAMCDGGVGVEPNAFTYSALISVCCNSRQCGVALELFQKMKKEVEVPEKMLRETYGTIIAACEREKLHKEVFDLYKEMSVTSIKPDRMTCACVLAVSAICKRWVVAAEVVKVSPPSTVEMYTKVIRGLGGLKKCKMAIDVFNSMRFAPVVPNKEVCHALVRAMENAGEAEIAPGFFKEMREGGIQASAKSYNSLLRLLARAGKWNDTVRVLINMDDLGMGVDATTSKTILECCIRDGESELAGDLREKFDCMKGRATEKHPTSQLCSIPVPYSYGGDARLSYNFSTGSYYRGSPTWSPVPFNPYYGFCVSPGSETSSIMTPRFL